MKRTKEMIAHQSDIKKLHEDATRHIENQEYQIAGFILARILELEPTNLKALKYHGFVHSLMHNYTQAEMSNRKALELSPNDVHSLEGLGLTLYKKGETGEGINLLKQAVLLTGPHFMEPYSELALIYLENNQREEARLLLKEARNVNSRFYQQNLALYAQVSI